MRRLLPFLVVMAWAGAAHAGVEAQGELGGGGVASTWAGDRGAASSLRLGLRFADIVAGDVLTRLGYVPVDDRVITYLSLGGTVYGRIGKVRPYARVAVVHQHEESRSAIAEDKSGAAFGVGNGIRHRGGFGGSLGADFPLYAQRATQLFIGADATTTYFTDTRGPQWYFGGNLWLGMNFKL